MNKNKALLLLIFSIIFNGVLIKAQSVSTVWVSDLGNGTYKNPVLYADYSDPGIFPNDEATM